jgi:hypothetical protein
MDLDDAKHILEGELDELDSFLYDLEGYISQMRSMITDAQGAVDNEDGMDAVRSEVGDIEGTANDMFYDAGQIDSYVARIVDAADQVEAIQEEEKEEEKEKQEA